MVYGQILLCLLVLAAPFTWASCVVSDLSDTHVCYGLVGNVSSALDEDTMADYVALEAVKFTGGTCDDTSCDVSSVQGSATQECYDAVMSVVCAYAAGPDITDETSACEEASDLVPVIATCDALFTTCSATVTASADQRDYCSEYACSSCGVNGTCTSSFTGGYSTCVCDDNIIGTECATVAQACPVSSNGFDCSGHGVCDQYAGSCDCVSEFSGTTCASVSCLHADEVDIDECNSHGVCRQVGVCQCDAGWIGASCTLEVVDAGMTSGEFAGAVIGGLIFGGLFCGMGVFAMSQDD